MSIVPPISPSNLNLFKTIQNRGHEFWLSLYGFDLSFNSLTYTGSFTRVADPATIYNNLSAFVQSQQTGWIVIETELKPSGLDVAVFKNGNDIVIYAAGNDADGTTSGHTDVHFSGTPQFSDIVPVTAFEMVKIYQDIAKLYPEAGITLSGHSIGGSIA